MCKVVGFTNSSKMNIKRTSEKIGALLLDSEKDGYGYAVQGATNVYGEKCIAPEFKSRMRDDNVVKLPIVVKRQEIFGTPDKPMGPAIFHGRTCLRNCHPMQREGWHLIHNGVVTDHGPKYKKLTTNDSEDLLHRLIGGISEVENLLTGYFAFLAIDPKGRLHVARDNSASLYMAWCPNIQSMVFATTYSLLEDISSELNIKMGPIDKVESNIYCIFEGNKMVHKQTISPRGWDRRESQFASRSLGYDLDDGPNYGYVTGRLYKVPNTTETAPSVTNPAPTPDAYGEYTEEAFRELLRELDHIDDTYTIHDCNARIITAADFRQLDDVSKFQCMIERPDGTLIELYNFNLDTPAYYGGAD
jgi:hypothetical protein